MSNADKEYRFKYTDHFWTILIILPMSFISSFVLIETGVLDMLHEVLASVLGDGYLTFWIIIALMFTPAYLCWQVAFSFLQAEAIATLHKDSVTIKLKNKQHVIKYNRIAGAGNIRGATIDIIIKDGSDIAIMTSLKLSIRNFIAVMRFTEALRKAVHERVKQ